MAQITSGASADLWTIDPTSKAGRVTLYDTAGNEVQSPPNGSYLLPINIRQTAATAASSTVWSMRNGATRTISIRRILAQVAFDGTAAAATTVRYKFMRFATATPTTGTALTAIKKRSSYGASTVADARFLDTGLSVTSVVFETEFLVRGVPIAVTNGVSVQDIPFITPGERFGQFELAVNEGLAIQLAVAAVVGQTITGCVEYDER